MVDGESSWWRGDQIASAQLKESKETGTSTWNEMLRKENEGKGVERTINQYNLVFTYPSIFINMLRCNNCNKLGCHERRTPSVWQRVTICRI